MLTISRLKRWSIRYYNDTAQAAKQAGMDCHGAIGEIADAPNRRLHDTLTTAGPIVRVAREQEVRVGDLVVSRR
jgi:hypothetical protein